MKTRLKRMLQIAGVLCFTVSAVAVGATEDATEMASEPWEARAVGAAVPANPDSSLEMVSQGAAESYVYCVPCFQKRVDAMMRAHTAAAPRQAGPATGPQGGQEGGR